MPTVKDVWKAQGNRSLEEVILQGVYDSLTGPDEEEEDAYENPYREYQGYPVEFCERFLEVKFTDDVKEMMESAQKLPETLGKSANSTGKTHAAACFLIYWYLVYDDAQVYTLAAPPVENLELLLWGEITSIVESFPYLFSGHKITTLRISRGKKSFITGLAIPQSANPQTLKARFSGKHAPHLLFVADEGDGVPQEIYEAIDGCMSGGMARLLVLFNPRAESGPVYLKETRNQANVVTLSAFTHPNVMTGRDIIPGAVTQNVTVKRIQEQTIPLRPGQIPNNACFEVPSFLVGVVAYSNKGEPYPPLRAGWRRIVSPEFSYMVLGRYPTQAESQLIDGEWVRNVFGRYELWQSFHGNNTPRIRPFCSLDVADILGADTNCQTFYYGSFVPPQIIWSEEDVVETGNIAAANYAAAHALWCNVDATGVGAGAWAQMKRKGCVAYRIMVGSKKDLKKIDQNSADEEELEGFENIRAQMLWGLREFFRTDKSAAVAPDEELYQELVAARYWKDINGKICISSTDAIKAIIRRSPDRLMSMALRWAKRPRIVDSEIVVSNYAGFTTSGKSRQRVGLGLPQTKGNSAWQG